MTQTSKNEKQRGVSIYIALVILVILLVTTFGLVDILLKQRKTTKEIDLSAIALGAANAGIEQIFYLDKKCESPDCKDVCDGITVVPPSAPGSCCKQDCSGLKSGFTMKGTTTVSGPDDIAEYRVVFGRNCGINTATSTGSYKGVSKTISTSFGTSAAGIYLNEATTTCPAGLNFYYSCNELCESLDCSCYSIGTNPEANNSMISVYNPITSECGTVSRSCGDDIIRMPECGDYSPYPPQGQCDGGPHYPETHNTSWTHCYCTSSKP